MENEIIIWSEMGTKEGIDYRIGQKFVYNDGGREAAGYKGTTGDCVTRAIAIVTEKPYKEVYNTLNIIGENEKRKKKKSNSRTGVFKSTYDKYLKSLGYIWIPCMKIGSGCKVHLRSDELPEGRLIVRLSRHLSTVIDGVIHDIFDCSRHGTRCVYGYYYKPE
jgi:hypothetical protein